MNTENILWAPIILKIGALLFLAFIVFLLFKTIRHQQQIREVSDRIVFPGLQITTNILPILVAILAGLAALWVAFSGGLTSIEISSPQKISYVEDERILDFKKQIKSLESHLNNIQQATVSTIGKGEETNMKNMLALLAESKTISEENAKAIKSFESLILSDAEKLLTLPLLKRDLSSISSEIKSLKSDVNTLRSLMAESSNQNRWLIGTLALGMLALVLPAIRSLLSGRKMDQQNGEKKGSNNSINSDS